MFCGWQTPTTAHRLRRRCKKQTIGNSPCVRGAWCVRTPGRPAVLSVPVPLSRNKAMVASASSTATSLALSAAVRSLSLFNATRLTPLGMTASCAADLKEIRTDPHINTLQFNVSNIEAMQLISSARNDCARNVRRCRSGNTCCSSQFGWTRFTDSLHRLAFYLRMSGRGKLCFTDATIVVDASGLTLEQHFSAAIPVAMGSRCLPSDADAVLALSATTCSKGSGVQSCHLTMQSSRCGSHTGRCEDWSTLSFVYPYCDPPGGNPPSKWDINLDVELGQRCSYDRPGCCWTPLGYGGGPPFGSSCAEECRRFNREGRDDAFCQRSDHSHFGNCFCGEKVEPTHGRYCFVEHPIGRNPCASSSGSDYCCDVECSYCGPQECTQFCPTPL